MPIAPLDADLLTLRDAAKLLPPRRGGSRIAISTLWRWASRGCGGVRLEIIRVGGVAYTTREAIAEFVAKRSIPAAHTAIPTPSPTVGASSSRSPTPRSRHAVEQLNAMNPSRGRRTTKPR
jgi:hypothetical protein